MYSTCLFCHSPLGANGVVEHFPVGRRLAFDAAKGRLWVVCRKCERWNLTPIEERWEAIEECERMFRDTKLRVSTDNIGLSRVSEGLELVRIGEPRRPEMAAWRYGDQFGRRQRRYLGWGGAVLVGVGGVYLAGPALGLYATGGVAVLSNVATQGLGAIHRRAMRVKLAMPGAAKPLIVSHSNVRKASLMRADSELGWVLTVPVRPTGCPHAPWKVGLGKMLGAYRARATEMEFEGDEAIRVAGQLLPKINAAGAGKSAVRDAVQFLEARDHPRDAFAYASGTGIYSEMSKNEFGVSLGNVPRTIRLALEMAAHEDTERRALEGELAMLQAQWKDAEEIAAISDNMFLPAGVEAWIGRQKQGR